MKVLNKREVMVKVRVSNINVAKGIGIAHVDLDAYNKGVVNENLSSLRI